MPPFQGGGDCCVTPWAFDPGYQIGGFQPSDCIEIQIRDAQLLMFHLRLTRMRRRGRLLCSHTAFLGVFEFIET